MELPPLQAGVIHKRYKRFLADVELPDGELVTVHCPNTGAMTTCWKPGAPVELSHSNNPKRKYAWTLERVDMGAGWVGVNTIRVNAVVAEAILLQRVENFWAYPVLKREPSFTVAGYPPSKFDLLLSDHPDKPQAYVEIKNATLLCGDTITFPDAVTVRGQKHLELLREAVKQGYRAAVIFAINRPEGRWFEPAWDIDPDYGYLLEEVAMDGVEIIAVRLRHTATGISVSGAADWVHPYCKDRSGNQPDV